MQYVILVFSAFAFLSGCAMGPKNPVVNQIDEVSLISKTTDLQSVYVKAKTSPVKVCAERMADAADSIDYSFGIGFGTEKTSEGAGDSAVGLGGRNPAVLIARELLYRSCEFSLNHNLSKEEALDLAYRTLDTLVQVSKVQTQQGTPDDTELKIKSEASRSSESDSGIDSGGWLSR